MQRHRTTRQGRAGRGFSLLELLIVVAIILIIAAIAIPNLLRSRIAANESAAVAACKKIVTAQVVYASTYGGSYSAALAQLGPPPGGGAVDSNNAGLLDEVIIAGTKHGYDFTYTARDRDGDGNFEAFEITAAPNSPGLTGIRYFYTNHSGVVRQSLTGPADENSTPVG